MTNSSSPQAEFRSPAAVYTAASNIQAHMIVKLLATNDIPAHAVEDQSGVSLWAMGTIPQFHQPRVWVEESDVPKAAALIREFEQKNQARTNPETGGIEIEVVCEGCGKTSTFLNSQNGTTQDCGHCGNFIDVGESALGADFDAAELPES